MHTLSRTKQCTCGARMIPCVYGYPSAELLEKSERGEVVLMGCVVRDTSPTWFCPECRRYSYD